MPNSDDDALRLECTQEAFEALHPSLQEAIRRAARRYHDARPDEPPWRVTSARRTLRRQAELMAACTPEQLLAMYASRGRPQYIDAILAAASIALRRRKRSSIDGEKTLKQLAIAGMKAMIPTPTMSMPYADMNPV